MAHARHRHLADAEPAVVQNLMKPDMAQPFGASCPASRRRGFTLIELLVVIAITAVLFFLLVRPLIESLRLTQRAQLQAAAQDSARKTLEIISRELSSAVYVFDNASHPFTLAPGTVPTASDSLFTNFLDLDIPNDPNAPTSPGTTMVAHAFNAKLDFVPARRSMSGGLIDPTTGDPIAATQSGSGSATLNTTGLQFPLAPGTTIIRYFVGLKDPTISYRNTAEKLGLNTTGNANNVDNTYVLYRVQFPLYKKSTDANGEVTYSVNADLLRPNATTGKPELDDPDFFRYVSATDIDWLSPTHAAYGANGMARQNGRVDNWEKIAKPVITAPNIDLLVLPRYADGTPIYDANHVPSSGSTTDPVRAGDPATPTVKTSINFTPATVTGDAAPSTSSDYSSLGIPMNAADNGGLPYVPTVYTASSQSWGFPPHITLAPQTLSVSTPYYTTDLGTSSTPPAAGIAVSPGDLMEYYHAGTADPANPRGTAVYDVTQGIVLQSATLQHSYVPLAVNPDTGTLSFDMPALPNPNNQNSQQSSGYQQYNRYWTASADDVNKGNLLACPAPIGTTPYGYNTPGILDLTNLTCDTSGNLTEFGATGNNTSPLPKIGQAPTALQCANAFIVPGSVRVYGPDQTEGPNKGNSILYTLASPGVPLTYNQYRVDYLNSLLTFDIDAGNQLPIVQANGSQAKVQITFNYQANLAPADTTHQISGTNPASPLLVKVDYQTRDLLDINIGVRVYDPTNGQAFIVPVSNRVKVNNSNR